MFDSIGQLEIFPSGQSLIERHDDEGKAITSLMRLAAQKQRRGYQR